MDQRYKKTAQIVKTVFLAMMKELVEAWMLLTSHMTLTL